MICAKPGGNRLPHMGTESVYVIMREGDPIAAALSYPEIVKRMDEGCDIKEVPWLG